MDRRKVLAGLVLAGAAVPLGAVVAQEVIREIEDLRPGEFTWHPERQTDGPVAVVVSLPEQLVHVYRNGIRIAVSTCSSGKPGHTTPRGVFVVLQKDKDHRSSTYNNAPMPNMNRLTWSGIALHAGNLPGYPASHGCVRLPLEFSERLFGITHIGTPVIIADDHGDPWELTHPGMILSGAAEGTMEQAEAALNGKGAAADWIESASHPVASVLVSSYERRALLVENGAVIAESDLSVRGSHELGSNVLVLQGLNGGGMAWVAVTHGNADWDGSKPDDQVLARISVDQGFADAMSRLMHPGMMVVTTDLPLHPDTRTGSDFVIMS